MTRYSKTIKICGILLGIGLAIIVACNVIVVHVSSGKCYDDIDAIPQRTFGLLLGTGRSSDPSPYYDARVEAAIELLKNGKIDRLIISGEELYPDYNEIDSMAAAVLAACPETEIIDDRNGTNTYASLSNLKKIIPGNELTIISQSYHNQRAVFYGTVVCRETLIAYNAKDTDIWYWDIWRFIRESLARTKAVFYPLYADIKLVFSARTNYHSHIH